MDTIYLTAEDLRRELRGRNSGKENPMKFFHLSDLHLGLRLFTRDLREDQEYILNRIVEAAAKEQPDAVVIAGDIYDKAVPSAESVELFDSFLTGLTKAAPEAAIMMIRGLNTWLRASLKVKTLHRTRIAVQSKGST